MSWKHKKGPSVAGFHTHVVWRGPSLFDGGPIMVTLTSRVSGNVKTGDMPQVYVLRTDKPPFGAFHDGSDYSVCGCCALRKPATGTGGCYVPTVKLRAHWDAAVKKPVSSLQQIREAIGHKPLRLGAYGDMAAVPAEITDALVALANGKVTNYTHGWKTLGWGPISHMKHYTMASVETEAEAVEARSHGWRTYRLIGAGYPLHAGEILCPYEVRKTQCRDCLQCGGHGLRGPHIAVTAHGSSGQATQALRVTRGEL